MNVEILHQNINPARFRTPFLPGLYRLGGAASGSGELFCDERHRNYRNADPAGRTARDRASAPAAGLILRYLMVSDIHGNREALDAVMKDARGKYDAAISCGDLCDYGPDSNYVIDWARANVAAVIRGNHDRVCSGLDTT